ncbi:MAG: hypothetical protein ACKO1U_00555, partial [Bacteroidota bacterium]
MTSKSTSDSSILGDVTLFASSATGLFTYDAVTGALETSVRTGIAGTPIGDLDMRRDGKLYAYAGVTGSAATAGRLLELDSGSGATLSQGDDGIPDPDSTDPLNFETASDDVTALAFRRTATGTFGELWFAVTDGAVSKLYRAADGGSATANASATANQKYDTSKTLGFRGTIAGAIVTGMQFVDEVGAEILAVTRDGRFITITPGDKADPDDIAPIDATVADRRTFATELTAIGAAGFEGLASAPLNLQGGRFAGTLFALTNNGLLCVIDPTTDALVDVPEWGGFFSPQLATGLTGIAFSPLDFNLWHPTTARGNDIGHGVAAAPDGSRRTSTDVTVTDGTGTNRSHTQGAGGVSMYFGLEEYVGSGQTPYLNYDAPRGQFGVIASDVHA